MPDSTRKGARRRLVGLAALAAVVLLLLLVPSAAGVGPYELHVSSSATRSDPVALDGESVAGSIYVFTNPETSDIVRVRFWLDDPQMAGTPRTTERNAPYDFAGTKSDAGKTAKPFDTTTIADGQHTITAAVELSSGAKEVVHATFTVANSGPAPPPTPALAFTPASLSFTSDEGGNPATKTATLTAESGTASATLSESAPWLTLNPTSTDTPQTIEVSADPAGLSPGTRSATVTATAPGYTDAKLTVSLTIGAAADQVHLAWVEDPATTLTVVWRTLDTSVPSVVEYRKKGATEWQSATGATRTSGTAGTLHDVTLRELAPATAYEYRVRSGDSAWSGVREARTAPTAGGTFDFVYVADTGLAGRKDGLTTGTEQVRDEIAELAPTLVLGGGDYAYFDTDKRFGTLEETIDAWFNQMQPIAAHAPLMPTYGNHEVVLDGDFFTNWAARFPTPAGFGERRYHSFDVGDAHFTSILAYKNARGLTQATLDWIDQDLAAAEARGMRWLIPFMHVPSFGDGQNHKQNTELRAQLAPIFEEHGVKLAIASHDQAYERSYPLTDVTSSSYTRTSTDTSCYTLADGVVWVKVSPGGKLSNISDGFSPFLSDSPPSWTASRDNTRHHFAHVRVSPTELVFSDYRVKGDGSTPVVGDTFRYTTGSCGTKPTLGFSPGSLSFAAAEDGAGASKTAELTASDGGAASVTLSEDASWLSVSPAAAQTPRTITFTVDPTGLAPGTYTTNVSATASGYTAATLPVTLTVTGAGGSTYGLLVSTSSNRAGPVPLPGRTVSGKIYVFTSPDTPDIVRVRFWLDNPQMTGTPRRTERSAPYDLAGGTETTANAFDTRTIGNGAHTITAAVDLASGATEVASATFTVGN